MRGAANAAQKGAGATSAVTTGGRRARLIDAAGARICGLPGAAREARTDLVFLLCLTALAGALRLPALDSMPPGFHGDEAWTGLDARRVLREGWIGPYVGSALGQPTGPLYFTAALFKLLGDSAHTVRFAMALLGTATVPAAYLAFAQMFNRRTAAFAAVILATMTWHVHLSRTGFMAISWPLMEMVTLALLWAAFRRRGIWLYLLAGAAFGLGVYTYNAYVLFVPLPFIALIWVFFRQARAERIRYAAMCAAFVAAALLAAMPMLRYVDEHTWEYRYHQRQVSVQSSPAWKEADARGRVEILKDRARELQRGLTTGGEDCGGRCYVIDYGDGLGAPGVPVLGPLISVFAVVGLMLSLLQLRRPAYAVLVAAAALLPLGALLTEEWGMYRRTLGLSPFVAALAAIALVRIWDAAASRRGAAGYALAAAVLAVPAWAGTASMRQYFGHADGSVMEYVYGPPMREASEFIDGLSQGTQVYFYSARWSFGYETRRYIAPDAVGIDRSREFRQPKSDAPLDFSIDAAGDVAFVLLEPYQAELEQLRARYPEGQALERRDGDTFLFAVYLVPRR